MDANDLSSLANLELMRQIVSILPEDNKDSEELKRIILGLTVPDMWKKINNEIVYQTNHHPTARKALSELLPKLHAALPDEPLVIELIKRYPHSSHV